MERFTEGPVPINSHFTFTLFEWEFVFRLEFRNSFVYSGLLCRSNYQTRRRGGCRGEAFLCE